MSVRVKFSIEHLLLPIFGCFQTILELLGGLEERVMDLFGHSRCQLALGGSQLSFERAHPGMEDPVIGILPSRVTVRVSPIIIVLPNQAPE